jgi:hypothetical protein
MATKGTWEELFGNGRKWRVAEEVTGEVTERGYTVRFTRGQFETPPGSAFRSLLSTNLGRRGYILTETNADGSQDIPGSRIAVGEHSVTRARQEFSAVW